MLPNKQDPHFWTTMLANKKDTPPKAGNHIGPKLTLARSDFDSLNFQIPFKNWLFVEGPKKEKHAFSVALANYLCCSMIANKLPQP